MRVQAERRTPYPPLCESRNQLPHSCPTIVHLTATPEAVHRFREGVEMSTIIITERLSFAAESMEVAVKVRDPVFAGTEFNIHLFHFAATTDAALQQDFVTPYCQFVAGPPWFLRIIAMHSMCGILRISSCGVEQGRAFLQPSHSVLIMTSDRIRLMCRIPSANHASIIGSFCSNLQGSPDNPYED